MGDEVPALSTLKKDHLREKASIKGRVPCTMQARFGTFCSNSAVLIMFVEKDKTDE
jgi:hypothetical protein